jgi:hypothetical protein
VGASKKQSTEAVAGVRSNVDSLVDDVKGMCERVFFLVLLV